MNLHQDTFGHLCTSVVELEQTGDLLLPRNSLKKAQSPARFLFDHYIHYWTLLRTRQLLAQDAVYAVGLGNKLRHPELVRLAKSVG
ncbi:MAG: hypothetical protein SXV54_17895 [Chloroflexota bacterium]|nr:hypothetical protein [Chloroflexota bacterium]